MVSEGGGVGGLVAPAVDPRTLCPLTFAAASPQGVSFKVERCLQHSAGTVPPPQLSLLRPGASRQMPTSLCVQERVPAATFPDSPRGLRRGATLPHCANGARSPPSQEAGPGESFSVPPSASLAIFNLSNEPCYKYSLALVADQDTQERAAPPLRSLATPARHAPWPLSPLPTSRPPARPCAAVPTAAHRPRHCPTGRALDVDASAARGAPPRCCIPPSGRSSPATRNSSSPAARWRAAL